MNASAFASANVTILLLLQLSIHLHSLRDFQLLAFVARSIEPSTIYRCQKGSEKEDKSEAKPVIERVCRRFRTFLNVNSIE